MYEASRTERHRREPGAHACGAPRARPAHGVAPPVAPPRLPFRLKDSVENPIRKSDDTRKVPEPPPSRAKIWGQESVLVAGRGSAPKASPSTPPPFTAISINACFHDEGVVLLSSSCTELWRVIKEGFKPHDANDLSRREVVDDQLNATALHMIHLAVTPKDRAHIPLYNTTKEAWDKIDALFVGNESIQDSKFEEVNTTADDFVTNERETVEDMYLQLVAFVEQTQDLGGSHADN
ncbi:hypothetical protein QYE76_032325 [Lolium multiflorum]|uniref:Uncharacterized protein n=1 Tax=Lolium multiflorum TaxID=4521 RepID=A0AAD8QVK0_LOLMU|nr:hypothetical protein QYE76_032325 [Lolium multiflorum]